jgi:hypothetical protein
MAIWSNTRRREQINNRCDNRLTHFYLQFTPRFQMKFASEKNQNLGVKMRERQLTIG